MKKRLEHRLLDSKGVGHYVCRLMDTQAVGKSVVTRLGDRKGCVLDEETRHLLKKEVSEEQWQVVLPMLEERLANSTVGADPYALLAGVLWDLKSQQVGRVELDALRF